VCGINHDTSAGTSRFGQFGKNGVEHAKTAPADSRDGNSLSSGAQAMNLVLGDAEALLSLSLKDNGAFAGKATEFRVTAFFSGGERAMCTLNAQ
jgi:hypothetical protein